MAEKKGISLKFPYNTKKKQFRGHGTPYHISFIFLFQSYLRTWALELEVPILSVDYSLAPDLPFPRALEECFYAYAWALKNPSKLGKLCIIFHHKNTVFSGYNM